MSEEEIVRVIVDFLADDAGVGAAELYEQLIEQGYEMPVDSLLAVDVLVRVQARCGVTLPASEETARAMGSVRAFAQAVKAQMDASPAAARLA